ncbi:MAG: L,D-transpeptidase family protein [Clostridiales bacterium]|nr:L,D-transpeptidase family protein [Clostridiales bacterium]
MRQIAGKKCCLQRILVLALVFSLVAGILSPFHAAEAEAAYQGKYMIKVNRKMSTVTIYERQSGGKYKAVKAMACSPGYGTPLGTFYIPAKYRWQLLDGNVWGQYCSRIKTGILFHSVWYYERDPSTLCNREYNKLGTIASHGCVRLNVQDCKWIYDNCPIGTQVVIYDSSDPGPLGKPETIKITSGTRTGYDPTDIWSKNNPYNKKAPKISGASSKTVMYGQKVDLKKGVTAKSTTNTSLTSKIKITITLAGKKVAKIDTKNPGNYKVTYQVTDLLNRTAKKTITVKVKPQGDPLRLTGVKDKYVAQGNTIKAAAMDGVALTCGKKTLSNDHIKVKIVKQKKGVYRVTYTASYTGKKTVEKKAVIRVDYKPAISGASSQTIATGTALTKELALKGVTIKDDRTSKSKLDIQVSISYKEDTMKYKVVYKVIDEIGNVAKKTVYYTVVEANPEPDNPDQENPDAENPDPEKTDPVDPSLPDSSGQKSEEIEKTSARTEEVYYGSTL